MMSIQSERQEQRDVDNEKLCHNEPLVNEVKIDCCAELRGDTVILIQNCGKVNLSTLGALVSAIYLNSA